MRGKPMQLPDPPPELANLTYKATSQTIDSLLAKLRFTNSAEENAQAQARLAKRSKPARPIPDAASLIQEQGALVTILGSPDVYLNYSSGKDSENMVLLVTAYLTKIGYRGNIRLIQTDMQRADWFFTRTHSHKRAAQIGLPYFETHRTQGDLLDRIDQRSATRPDVPCWPSKMNLYCSTDVKTSVLDS